MTLSKEQKTALTVGGIAVVVILLLLYGKKTTIIPSNAVLGSTPIYSPEAPGYTLYNTQNGPPPSIAPKELAGLINCGCNTKEGCFTSSPIDTGRGPVALEQLLALYASRDPSFTAIFAQTQRPYAYPPQTLSELARPNPLYDLSLGVSQRYSDAYALGGVGCAFGSFYC